MSASAMTTFVRDLFKQTEDYKSLTQRIIRDRYMKHIDVVALTEDDRMLLREIVDFIVKEMIENSADDVEQENIAENNQPSNTEDRTRQNKNMNEKSVKCSSDLEEDDVNVTKKGKKNRIIDDSDFDGNSEESKSNENVASSNDDEDLHSEPQHGKRKQPKISEAAPKKVKLSDSSNKSKKLTKKEAISKKMQSDGSDSETSSIEDKKSNISQKSNVASINDDEDSHSEPHHGKRKQPKTPKAAPKKIKLSDSSNKSKKPTKEAISKKMLSSGSDSETSSIEDKKSNISHKSKPRAKAVIPNSKKLLKKQKLSSSEDEALENEDDNIVNKKIFEGSDSDESEPLQTYKDKDKKEKADLSNNKKVINKKKQLKSDEESSSSESDDQTLADVRKPNPKQLSATDSGDQSETIAISKSKSKKKSVGKSRRVEEEKKKFKGKKQSSKTPTKEADDKDETVKKLEKIARACGALPVGKHYKLAFEDCRNNKERAEKLKQMLRDAGMTGTFSMKSAETLKLKREAAELLCESSNISGSIMSEGRGRRSANNPFSTSARNSKDMSTSKAATIESAKTSFSRLKGIVDSEEESD